jgi:hypothetical protein
MDMDETRISTAKTPSREVLMRISGINTHFAATEWQTKTVHSFNRRTNHRAISKSVAIRSPILQEPFAPTLNP